MFDLIVEIGLIIGILASAIYVAEAKPISRAIGGFIIFSVLVAILYLYLNCPYLAGSQIAIYTGAVAGLMLLGMSITRPEYPEEEGGNKVLLGFVIASVLTLISFIVVYYSYPYAPGITPGVISEVLARAQIGFGELERFLANYLWNYRGFDVIFQAVMVIAIAAGLSHFFKEEREARKR